MRSTKATSTQPSFYTEQNKKRFYLEISSTRALIIVDSNDVHFVFTGSPLYKTLFTHFVC